MSQQTVSSEVNSQKIIKQLKVKCNMQLDELEAMQEKLKQAEAEIEKLQTQLKEESGKIIFLQEKNNTVPFYEKNEAMDCLNSFCRILKKIVTKNEFIIYKNETKNSRLYCKVEKSVFEAYVDSDPDIKEKSLFYNMCVDLALIKSDESRKYIFNDNKDNQQIRIIFISKYIINVLTGEYRHDR